MGDKSSQHEGRDLSKLCGLDWIRGEAAPEAEPEWPEVRVVDLFCGCGGMSLGVREALRLAGFRMKVALAVDLMEEATQVYARAFDCEGAVRCADVAEVLEDEHLLADAGGVNILVAGPPCQGHSDLNNHTRRNDERNSLYETAARFAVKTDADIVIIENVPGARHDASEVVQKAEKLLAKKYYTNLLDLEADDFGIPQRRKRLFLVGSKVKIDADALEFYDGEPAEKLRPFIEDLEDEHDRSRPELFRKASRMSHKNQWRAAWLTRTGATELRDDMRPRCHRGKDHSYNSVYGRLSYEKLAQTITTGFGSMGQGRYLHPNSKADDLRVITPHEAARIQGLPDFLGEQFDLVETRKALHGMIGNAVPPKLAAVLVSNLLEAFARDVDAHESSPSGRSTLQLAAAE